MSDTAVKVSACGTVVRLDFGAGFVTMGNTDSITPFGRSKAVVDTPTLDCDADTQELGRQEASNMTFTHYWDHQDVDHIKLETNFDGSVSDATLKTISAQLIVPSYATGTVSPTAAVVTYEAEVQIQAIAPEEVTPDGYFKQTVTLLRKGDITKTTV